MTRGGPTLATVRTAAKKVANEIVADRVTVKISAYGYDREGEPARGPREVDTQLYANVEATGVDFGDPKKAADPILIPLGFRHSGSGPIASGYYDSYIIDHYRYRVGGYRWQFTDRPYPIRRE